MNANGLKRLSLLAIFLVCLTVTCSSWSDSTSYTTPTASAHYLQRFMTKPETDPRTRVMPCTRWATLVSGASKFGVDRFMLVGLANGALDKNDISFLNNDIIPLIEARGGEPIEFATAMFICGEAFSS